MELSEANDDLLAFEVDGNTYYAARNVIANASPYFHTLLSGEFLEATENPIHLNISDPFGVFPNILTSLTSKDTSFVNKNNMIGVLALAYYFRLKNYVGLVENVAKTLEPADLESLITDLYTQPPINLTPSLIKFLAYNFIEGMKNETLAKLPPCIIIPVVEKFPHSSNYPTETGRWVCDYIKHTYMSGQNIQRLRNLPFWAKIPDYNERVSLEFNVVATDKGYNP